MKQNELGTSGIFISELTLGCMSLGTDPEKARRIIDAALDSGINHLDTADLYDFGKNEELVGQAIRHKRQQLILTSKVGNHFDPKTGTSFWDPSREHILNGAKESLRRLGTDYLDFYMLHGGTTDDPIEESIDAFETLKKEGLIRAYGISSIRPNVIREYVKRSAIDGVMMQYSLLDRRPEEKILGLLGENRISVLARGPLAKGMLSTAALQQLEKKGDSGYLDYSAEQLKETVHKLQSFAGGRPLNELAFGYVLRHPGIATAVFGASSAAQLEENLAAGQSALSDHDYDQLQQLTKQNLYTAHR